MYLKKLINAMKRLPYSLNMAGVLIATLVVTSTSVAGQGLMVGQEHSYDVYLRGNGEALVAARVVVNNTNEEDMTSVVLKAPEGINVSELHAAQELRPSECVNPRNRYDRDDCEEFRPPDYSESSSYYGYRSGAKFQRVAADVDNGTITVELGEAIKPNTNGALLLSFVTRGFVEPTFGKAYNFTAKSLRADQRITEANMAVYSDTDYRIRDAESDVRYAPVPSDASELQTAEVGMSVESDRLSKFSQRVGKSGHITKTARALAPDDVMEVSGFAAQNWWRLNLVKLLIIGLVLAGIIAGLVYWWRRAGASSDKSDENGRSHDTATQKSEPAESQTARPLAAHSHGRMYIVSILLGLVSALAVMGITALLLNMEDLFGGGSDLLTALQGLAVVATYLFVFLAPAIFAGIRYGLRWGLLTVGAGLLWVVLLVVISSVLFADSMGTTPTPRPGLQPH